MWHLHSLVHEVARSAMAAMAIAAVRFRFMVVRFLIVGIWLIF